MINHSTATLNVIRAAMELAERDERLGLVTVEQIQSLPRTRFATAERKQVAALLKAEGKSNREIAKELGVGHQTVGRDLGGSNGPESGPNGPPESNGKAVSAKPAAHVPAEDDDDDEIEPDIESKVNEESKRDAFLIRADQARKFAIYSGPIDDDVRLMARQVAAAWSQLAQNLAGGKK